MAGADVRKGQSRAGAPTTSTSGSFTRVTARRARDEDPTHQLPAREVSPGGGSAGTPVEGAEPSSPIEGEPSAEPTGAAATADILRALEVQRAALFFRMCGVVCVLVLVALPVLPGAAWLRGLTAAQCGIAAIVCFAASHLASRPGRDSPYTPTVAATIAVALAFLGTGIIYYLGLFSASTTLLVVGIYFYGTSQTRRVAWTAYVAIASLYFVGTAAIALDVIPDRSVFNVDHVERASRLYRVAMQQAVFAVTFYLSRTSRRATQIAMERAHQADLELGQREAQLLETKGALDRALRPSEGRHTGSTIGPYVLGELLGRGGMGEVYAAEHAASLQRVAIKLLHPAALEDPTSVERFAREAATASAVPSEHVAGVLEVGKTVDGAPYMVMERLDGHDLAWHLRRTPQLDLAEVVEMVDHTARALQAVRDAGVVHRDLKPGNVFLLDSLPRRWKVLDFGLSKLQGASSLTQDRTVGTPAYMAPEQIRGEEVDHLADLYALTAVAYRALTGRAPFVGDTIAKVLMDALTRMPECPSAFAPLPVEVEIVLAIGLAKRKEDRFPCVEELADALRVAADRQLDMDTRTRGAALLRRSPWGATIEGAVMPARWASRRGR